MSKRRNKKDKKNQKLIGFISTLILLVLILCGTNIEVLNQFIKEDKQQKTQTTAPVQFVADDNLMVYFIDVGQADSILVINEKDAMLIDAGNNEDGEEVVNFIKEKEIEKLNYVIGTHPHEDHIGGLDDVISNIEVENIYMPKIETTTKTFEDVLDAISNKNLKITAPIKGETFMIGGAQCEIMTDSILEKKSLNLSSIIIKLTFGNNSFLFMGDAETKNEETRDWPKIDVLKVGHHGSNTSSSENFLKQVSPQYAVIMAGKNNHYGLPKANILERLSRINSTIYRTDENGTIEMISDGNRITVNTNNN